MPKRNSHILIVLCTFPAVAEEFSLQIASPVATQSFQLKSSAFAFRTNGCADPKKAEVSGTAEGLANGVRKSIPLKLADAPAPGVHAVFRQWPSAGVWVINLSARCAAAKAGVLAVVGSSGIVRESSQFFPRPATEPEIQTLLKSLERASNEPPPKGSGK